jgi:soluble P-type ATPase
VIVLREDHAIIRLLATSRTASTGAVEMADPKLGINISIPSLGDFQIKAICSDYTGTLSCGGELVDGVKKRLRKLKTIVDIQVVTSDTANTAMTELDHIPLKPHLIQNDAPDHHIIKREYLAQNGLEPRHVAVFGNGRNDREWLKLVKEESGLAIAVDAGEGCAIEAMENAHIFVYGIVNALDLLLYHDRIKATLRS